MRIEIGDFGSGTVFDSFRFFKPFTKRHLEGRKRVPRFHQRATSPERPCVLPPKTKGPSTLFGR